MARRAATAEEHPSQTLRCPAGAILDTWSNHEWTGGVQVDRMQDLESILVRTRNSTYEITILSSQTADVLVRGGRFFPEFTRAHVAGSSLGGSFLKLHGVYVGFNLELHAGRQTIITSPVQSISLWRDSEIPA